MPVLPHINLKRAWLLFAAVWLPLVAVYFWPRIDYSWYESNRVRQEINKSVREVKFQDCVRDKQIDWPQIVQRWKYECESQAINSCGGSLMCATEMLTDGCLKSKANGCDHLAWLVAGDGSETGLDDKAFKDKESRERITFYFERSFSHTLYLALAWALVPLVLPIVLPKPAKSVWRWLTAKQG